MQKEPYPVSGISRKGQKREQQGKHDGALKGERPLGDDT